MVNGLWTLHITALNVTLPQTATTSYEHTVLYVVAFHLFCLDPRRERTRMTWTEP